MPLPPPPINDQPGSFTWLEWYRQLRNYISTSGSVPWYIINFTGSNLTDLATREHQALQGVQGGTAGEKYHLTLAQHTDLTDGNDSTLHYHATDRDSANFTGTNWTDLVDGSSTTLHYHASDRDSANFTGTNWTDLTDGGATTLHKHSHNGMDGLQGGTTSEYYHFTNVQYTDILAGNFNSIGIGSAATTYELEIKKATARILVSPTTTTNQAWINFKNTGGDFYIGRDNSTGSGFGVGGYASILYSTGAYPVVIFANGTKVLAVEKDKTIALQGATSQAGSGITFPTSVFTSTDSNTLDDYEEGIVSGITITCGTSGTVTLDTSYDSLSYVKIGSLCHVQGRLVVLSVSSPVGYFSFPLPFTAASTTEDSDYSTGVIKVSVTNAANGSDFTLNVAGGGTVAVSQLCNTTTFANTAANELKAGSLIYVSLTYRTA